MNQLIQRTTKLREDAFDLIQQLNLEQLLSRYGQFVLIGSAKYNLMTWRDIDIDVVMKDDPTDEEYWEIVKQIFKINGNELTMLVDNRVQVTPDRPRSMYIGFKLKDKNNNLWRFDIRLISTKHMTANKVGNMIEKHIDDEKRRIILEIKTNVHDDPRYHKDYQSIDIYEAVLLNDVKTFEEFKAYIKKKRDIVLS